MAARGMMPWKKGGEKPSVRLPKPVRWYHLAATYDGKTARFHVNGKQAASRRIASAKWGFWGASVAGTSQAETLFDGIVDEAYVFSGALTAGEIASYHQAAAGQ